MIPQGSNKQQQNPFNCQVMSPDQIGCVGLHQKHRSHFSTEKNPVLNWSQPGAFKETGLLLHRARRSDPRHYLSVKRDNPTIPVLQPYGYTGWHQFGLFLGSGKPKNRRELQTSPGTSLGEKKQARRWKTCTSGSISFSRAEVLLKHTGNNGQAVFVHMFAETGKFDPQVLAATVLVDQTY